MLSFYDMAERTLVFSQNEFYHTYSRGADKRTIFNDLSDYSRFTELLYLSNSEFAINIRNIRKTESSIYNFERGPQLVYIGAYCLMPNHFHILLTPATEGGVQLFMQKLLTGYSMYFNKRLERRGTLFESRFKSEWADSDEYLKYLFSYIHLNPLKLIQPDWKEVGLEYVCNGLEYLDEYAFSSYYDYAKGERSESVILDKEKFPEYFPGVESFLTEINDWMNFKNFDPELKKKITHS